MNLDKAEDLAIHYMEFHGLAGWNFKWSNTKTSYGDCNYNTSTIRLSKILSKIVDQAHVLDTILHEIAHALVGPGHHHNHIWKQKCVEIGAQPNTACHTAISTQDLPPKWVLVFEGEVMHKWYRKPNKKTIDNVGNTYIKHRKQETLGKCQIIEYKEFNK